MSHHPGKVVTVYQFSELFASAFTEAFTPRNIVSSFRVSGVFPPNRKAIPIPGIQEVNKCQSTPTSKIAKSGSITSHSTPQPSHLYLTVHPPALLTALALLKLSCSVLKRVSRKGTTSPSMISTIFDCKPTITMPYQKEWNFPLTLHWHLTRALMIHSMLSLHLGRALVGLQRPHLENSYLLTLLSYTRCLSGLHQL